MRWINTNTVKCVSHEVDGHIVKSAGREMDGHKHCRMSVGHEMDWRKQTSEPPPPPPPPPACSNESLAHSYHTNRTNFLPRDMNETAANASAYIACKGIYESKTDYNKTGWKWWQTLFDDECRHKKILPRTCFLQKKAAASATHGNAARRKWRIIARM